MVLLEKFPFFIFGVLLAIPVNTIENIAYTINFSAKFNFTGRRIFLQRKITVHGNEKVSMGQGSGRDEKIVLLTLRSATEK